MLMMMVKMTMLWCLDDEDKDEADNTLASRCPDEREVNPISFPPGEGGGSYQCPDVNDHYDDDY